MHPAGCGCDETDCEYSRVRDTFELKVLWQPPASHQAAAKDDKQWCKTLQATSIEKMQAALSFPVLPCPPCTDDPWVVLATVTLPEPSSAAADAAGAEGKISFDDRRVLLATQRMQVAMLCL